MLQYFKKIRGRFLAYKKYSNDKKKYEVMVRKGGGIPITGEFPQIYDYQSKAGEVDSHYFLQDIYVADLIGMEGVKKHYDIGSRVDGFVSHLLTNPNLEEVVMIDIRPFPIAVKKLSFIQADATNLYDLEDESLESISSLHALEHFGLGRYGDPIDPLACFQAMKAIQRVTKKNGKIYISTPIAMKDACMFNAHRIFSPQTIVKQFEACELVKMAFIQEGFRINEFDKIEAQKVIHEEEYQLGSYDCGIFVFEKK